MFESFLVTVKFLIRMEEGLQRILPVTNEEFEISRVNKTVVQRV